jgi:hypothetical protein
VDRAEGKRGAYEVPGGELMFTKELVMLFEDDAALYKIFEAVATERKIRFRNLLESLHMDREDTLDRLRQLEDAGLIKSQDASDGLEDLRWYSLTARGYTAEPELSRLRSLELVP